MELNLQLQRVIDIIKENFDPIVIYLFGSAARNELREDSDIDIAFLTEYNSSTDPYVCFMKSQELADILNRDVDLINLNESSTVFKVQVINNGKILYCKDETERLYFEMRSFKEYAMLNEERNVILKSIKERGSVYGK